MQATGLSPLQCLKMATRDAAKVLGMEEKLGTLEKGKWADLAIYHIDPIKEVQNFRTLLMVFKSGRSYHSGNLEYPQPFDLDYWIHQWEKTKFKKGLARKFES